MSFINKMNALKIRLQNNQALTDFCQTNFRRNLSVRRFFKNRAEINASDLPLIFITRPIIKREFAGNISKKEHSIALYCLLHWPEEDDEGLSKAQDLSIEFEELIEDAVHLYTGLTGDISMALTDGDSENDEGMFHPVYAFVMHLIIKDR